MNREIKFRALSTNTRKMVYGYFGYGWDSKTDLKPSIQSEPIVNWTSFTRTIIDIETLGQYTGLKDSKGTKIYEDDTFKYTSKKFSGKGRVVFEDGMFCVSVSERDKPDKLIPLNKYVKKNFVEVTGNVHNKK
jgi:uncharacterized phage protein (TIGR01671 family)